MRSGAPLLFLFLLLSPLLPADRSGQPAPAFNTVRSGNYAAAIPAPGPVRILDWNIDRGARLREVAEAIAVDRPELCLLQEVDLNAARSGRIDVADELARRLKMNYALGLAFQEVGQGSVESPAWQGQATLSAFPIRSARVLRYARQTSFWAPQPWLPNRIPLFQRRAGGRIALVSEIDVNGRTVVVYNLHLESRGPGAARFAQLGETLADARRYGAETPVLLAGDLNTKYVPSRFAHRLEAEGFVDCFGGRSGRTHRVIGRLDWIFVRGPLGCDSAEVDRHARGSDHFPLTAVLEIGTHPQGRTGRRP